ncbi:DUF2807 domain-containing protein [Erythrobacter mangrovi]|uniref:DUF2807 domain-containing protein n=2 Tax=Erythrobacter mangrovi TaxID=2739433 RepID=A0A7D3XJI0_9SPHN|nr:DUF2807 domain-containing protein [Erythrobacter mangrovi]
MIHKILKGLAPVAALAGAVLVSGCDGMQVRIGDEDAVPLSELDMSGKAPTELVLASPDRVIVSDGDTLDIDVSGDQDAVDALRFSLDGDTLGIVRGKDGWKDKGTATIRVTLPGLTGIVLAGSGSIEAASLSGKADVTIAGSGKASVAKVTAEALDLTIAGSGDFEASGSADKLDMTVAGSGRARMAGLKVDTADISVAGSGDTEFSSDGTVDASIMGSGTVTVHGRANCTVSAMGSGKLNCKSAQGTTEAPVATEAPEPPTAPEAPEAPEA